MVKNEKKQTPEQLQYVSELPFPEPEMLPQDLQKYMRVCKEKWTNQYLSSLNLTPMLRMFYI